MDQMPIELRSPLRKFSFAGVCLVLVGLYLYLALRAYLASHLAADPDSIESQQSHSAGTIER